MAAKPSRSDTSYLALLDTVIARRNPRRILEWGPGRSTQRMLDLLPTAQIDSVEHNPAWLAHWQQRLDTERATLHQWPARERYTDPPGLSGPYDLIFVDGRWRRRCLIAAAELLAPGGVVILHDAQRQYYHEPLGLYAHRLWDDYDTVALSQESLWDVETWLGQPGPRIPHVVMVTHGDRAGLLKRTIPAALGAAHPLTLTVVANAPGADSARYLTQLHRQGALYGLITTSRNVGKPLAANAGWRLRDADATVLLDDDALALHPAWLDELLAIVKGAPEAGIVGHSLEPADHKRLKIGPLRVQLQPGNLGGACILVPRRTLERCGRYDEALPPYGESDGLYGWKVRYGGLLCLYHDHVVTGRRFAHLDDPQGDDAYRAWKDARRAEAQPIAAELRRQYQSGRALNDYRRREL